MQIVTEYATQLYERKSTSSKSLLTSVITGALVGR